MKVPRERFSEVAQTWERLPMNMKKCPNCGRTLSGSVQDAWSDNQEEAWAYVTCERCGDIALWKIAKGWRKREAGGPQEDTRR